MSAISLAPSAVPVMKGPLCDYATDLRNGKIAGGATFPSDEDQALFTGMSGWDTLRQAVAFLKNVELGYLKITGRPIDGLSMLDFGCGWGRMLRLLPHYTDKIFGVDPWQYALDLCRAHRVPGELMASDAINNPVPFVRKFDLAFAYSVFTHTDRVATLTGLSALRRSMAPDGVCAITVRPPEYWDEPHINTHGRTRTALKADHAASGFAFVGHDGRDHYGDTSMSLDWIAFNSTGWHVDHWDRSIDDPMQIVVFLTPR